MSSPVDGGEDSGAVVSAALAIQRMFRQRQARRRQIAGRLRQMIFGRDTTLTAVTYDALADSEEGVDNNIERQWLGGRKREESWKPDFEFRETLEANCLDGHEQLYIRYAALENAIARQRSMDADEEAQAHAAVRQSLLFWATRGLLGSGNTGEAVFVECVNDLREELERLDAEVVGDVAAITATVEKLREEAAPRAAMRGGLYERKAIEILHKGRLWGLKNALKDVYKKNFILMQASSMNYVGLRKLQIRAMARLGKELAERAALPSREELRHRPLFLQMSDRAPPSTKAFFEAVDEIERIYANLFERGDLAKARSYLRSFREQAAEKPQVFLVGLQMGINLVLLVWMVWLLVIPSPGGLTCPFCSRYLSATLPVFRILLVPVVGIWAWALCVRQWERHNINYIYILEMSAFRHKSSFTHFKFAANALTLWLATFVMYVAAIRTGVYPRFLILPPSFYPPILLAAMILYSFWPSSSGNSPKNYFWPAVSKTIVRPFGSKPVGFMENLVADMLTSAVIVLRDIGTSIAFYVDGGLHGIPTKEAPRWLRHVQGPLITMLPYWWRLMQCLRRCYDAPSVSEAIPQLVNAGKYVVSLISIAMAVIGCEHGCSHFYSDKDKWSVGRVVWFSALVCGTLYSYVWDITMDWSLIEQVGDGRRCCFGLFPAFQLRRKRGLSWTWFYYWAAAANLVGRLSWAISINPNSITAMRSYSTLLASPQVVTTLVAVVEVLRRGQWTLLRVENEFLSNASHYRGVADVPVLITFAEMTLGRAHIHTHRHQRKRKLVGKEGIAILLAVIATAAAATVVYIATQKQSSGLI